VSRPLIASIEIGGPFKILAQQLWIKDQDRKPPELGEAILPAAVQASSSDTGSPPANLINGRGLLRNLSREGLREHSSDPSSMWRSAKGEAKGWVEFDFAQPRKLETLLVWNYNETWHTDRGVRKLDLSAWTPETGWQKIRDNQLLESAEGSNSYDEPTLVRFDAITAQEIRLDGLTSLGDSDYVGLSKVQFFAPRGPQATKLSPADGAVGVSTPSLVSQR
jgi:hypothetical protein